MRLLPSFCRMVRSASSALILVGSLTGGMLAQRGSEAKNVSFGDAFVFFGFCGGTHFLPLAQAFLLKWLNKARNGLRWNAKAHAF